MDEVFFRSSQKLENLQYQIGILATQSKNVAIDYTDQTKQLIVDSLNSERSHQLQEAIKQLYLYILSVSDEVRCRVLYHINPRTLLQTIGKIFGSRWSKREICFGCAGIVIGGFIGIGIGYAMHRQRVYRYMQAIQCTGYCGIEGATLVEDAIAPHSCARNEVLIAVKTGSVQIVDVDICKGYGKIIRRLLSKYYQYSNHDVPVTLGRDCAGIITDIGEDVTQFEIGDEVWATSPFWAPGMLSHIVLVPESKVGKKPRTIGFEGASSMPYAGGLALNALERAGIDSTNAKDKRIFVQGSCTPVGCILLQVLQFWGATVTTSCFRRAIPVANALGAHDIIILTEAEIKTKSSLSIQLPEITMSALVKELEVRDRFDVIINTRKCGVSMEQFEVFCDRFISTVEEEQPADTYDGLMVAVFTIYVRVKCIFQKLVGSSLSDFGEMHTCSSTLDHLAELVESGQVKTLVDKVYAPADIEKALYHIQSTESIGSTIISFK